MRPAEFDFETYSEAGFVWDAARNRWVGPPGASKNQKGLSVVGAAVYAEHPSTEILTLSYALPPHFVTKRWRPGLALPQDLFDYVASGAPIEAHNAFFEFAIWHLCAVRKYGWPATLRHGQMRCTMATARVNSLPGALAQLSEVLKLPTPKDAAGKKILDRVSVPQNPTKKDARLRITRDDDPALFEGLDKYCDTDLDAERGVAMATVPMSEDELFFWTIDQEINYRGIGVDRAGLDACRAVLGQVLDVYGEEHRQLTGFDATQLAEVRGWLAAQSVYTDSLDADHVEALLERDDLPPAARRAVEIRALTGSASVKKLYAMTNMLNSDSRLRNLIVHHGARTGRPTGEGPQPLNLPKAGPDLKWCVCGRPYAKSRMGCPWCGEPLARLRKDGSPDVGKWCAEAVDHALEIMAFKDMSLVELFFGDALLTISGCLRGLFQAGPGMELIASDYSAIEAVVLAMLAGEQWRIDAFRENKPIYLLGASKITGRSLGEYLAYKDTHGDHHPDRQTIGKVSELACGFGGWVGSYIAFGSTEPEDVIKRQILAWRAASPAIVEFWGGQFRGRPWDHDSRQEYYGVEGHFILAHLYPGQVFTYKGLQFYTRQYEATGTAVIIRLLSGRELTYHGVVLAAANRQYSRPGELCITYMTYNTNPKYGPKGWVRMDTYGGRLTENVVQATAHDLLRYGIVLLRHAGYPTVLHVYDEICVEVPEGAGSIEEVERLMSTMPPWAADWPVRAAGGWRGKRYRKA